MCIFSQRVEHVSRTRIFARADGARELIAYDMRFAAASDLAMILPLPVPVGSAEDDLCFFDLSAYPTLFDDLAAAFPRPIPRGQSLDLDAALAPAALKVHRVGAFEASFVPNLADFSRLDPRFRLPDEVWAGLPAHADYGFAVFALHGESSVKDAHPMAFSFPRRDPSRLFFPTVHVHDGEVHESADFDHELYAQGPAERFDRWQESPRALGQMVDGARSGRLVDGAAVGFRRELKGTLANQDVWV